MLDYKDIIVKHFGLGMSGRQIARELGVSSRASMTFWGHSSGAKVWISLCRRESPTTGSPQRSTAAAPARLAVT